MKTFVWGFRVSIALCLLNLTDVASGQTTRKIRAVDDSSTQKTPSKNKEVSKTTVVEFELLQTSEAGGLYAQQWLKVLEPLDVSLRIHRPSGSDKPELKEHDVGRVRHVNVIGTIDRSGVITFPNRTFSMGDKVELKQWVEELKTYGVQGSPEGKPLWGMTKEQFTELYDNLIKPVEFETEDQPLKELLIKWPLPRQITLRWSPEATTALAQLGNRAKIKQELKGFSAATALAVALNDNELAFRPNRTPAGKVELLVELRNPKLEQWPVGWPLQQKPAKAAPKFHAMVPIELSDIELSDVINAISKMTETPILVDSPQLAAKQIQLDKIRVSQPRKMTTWSIALRGFIVPKKMTSDLWQDEAGKVFVWITAPR